MHHSIPGVSTLLLLMGCTAGEAPEPRSEVSTEVQTVAADGEEATVDSGATLVWRPAVNEPPDGWAGPVFALSHDYPSETPAPRGWIPVGPR